MSDLLFDREDSAAQLQQHVQLLRRTANGNLERIDLGMFSFERFAEEIRMIASEFYILAESDFDSIPLRYIQSMDAQVTALTELLVEIIKFQPGSDLSGSDVEKWHESIILRIRERYATAYSELVSLKTAADPGRADYGERLRQLETEFGDVISEAKRTSKDAERLRTEVETIVDHVRQAAKKQVIGTYAEHFQKQATDHRKSSYGWMAAVVVLCALTLGAAWYLYNYQIPIVAELLKNENKAINGTVTTALVQMGFSKLIVFSTLYYLIVWAGKTARSHQHNVVVYKYRALALQTFQAFVDAADNDEPTKNAVLLKASEAIFGQTPTGYIGGDGDSHNSTQIFEIIRNIGGSK